MTTPAWRENRLTMDELVLKGKLKPGMALRFPGGGVELVGSMNELNGSCDDCPARGANEVPTHIAQLVRLDEIDSRIEPQSAR